MDWRTTWSRRTWSLFKKPNCQSHPRWQLLTFWVSMILWQKGGSLKNTNFQSVLWKDLWRKKTIWHVFTRCVALATRCSKWWNPIRFQLMFNLLIPPRSVSFVPRILCPMFAWCTSSRRLALLRHLSVASVFKTWSSHWVEEIWSIEWEIQVFCMWYEAQSLHIVF